MSVLLPVLFARQPSANAQLAMMQLPALPASLDILAIFAIYVSRLGILKRVIALSHVLPV